MIQTYDPHDHRFEKRLGKGNYLYAMQCPHHPVCANCGDCFECYHFSKLRLGKEASK